jgi:hypothetical protein
VHTDHFETLLDGQDVYGHAVLSVTLSFERTVPHR